MTKLLLSIHVLAAIIAIGPVTVAASMFPAALRRAGVPARSRPGSAGVRPDDDPAAGAQARSVARALHRICRVYATIGLVVPVFGLATAARLGVLADPWLLVSIALTALAAAVLVLVILPRQAALLAATDACDAGSTGDAGNAGNTGDAGSAGNAGDTGDGPNSEDACDPGNAATRRTSVASGLAGATRRLAMVTGVFNLLWAAVTVLMIVRPGSTTGA